MQSFIPIHFFVFKIRTIESGFADPKRFRDFREAGPWTKLFCFLKTKQFPMLSHFDTTCTLVHELVNLFWPETRRAWVGHKFKSCGPMDVSIRGFIFTATIDQPVFSPKLF